MATHRPASPDRSETDESQGGPEGRFPARSGDSSGWHPPRRSQIGVRIRHDTLSVLIKLKTTTRQSSGEMSAIAQVPICFHKSVAHQRKTPSGSVPPTGA